MNEYFREVLLKTLKNELVGAIDEDETLIEIIESKFEDFKKMFSNIKSINVSYDEMWGEEYLLLNVSEVEDEEYDDSYEIYEIIIGDYEDEFGKFKMITNVEEFQ